MRTLLSKILPFHSPPESQPLHLFPLNFSLLPSFSFSIFHSLPLLHSSSSISDSYFKQSNQAKDLVMEIPDAAD